MKLYLAGPLFTAQERTWNRDLAQALRRAGHEVFLPQEGEPTVPVEVRVMAVYTHDVEGLEWCDAVVANLDGPVVDDGTAWECGWAVARGKPVLGYRTDFRGSERGAVVNIMLAASCHHIVRRPSPEHGLVSLTAAIVEAVGGL